jgi:tetratricopeptide (TPR) repeat protein
LIASHFTVLFSNVFFWRGEKDNVGMMQTEAVLAAMSSRDYGRTRRSGGLRWFFTSAVLFAIVLLPPAGSQAAVSENEQRAAGMYDMAVERCGAGSLKSLNECNALLKQSVALWPDQALAHLTLGHTYRTLRSWDEAVSAFAKVGECSQARAGSLEKAPSWAKEDAGMHLGRALIELSRWDEAIHAFEATFTAYSQSSEALFRHLYLQHFACNFTRRTELLQAARERMVWEVQTRGGSHMTPSQALMMLEGPELRTLAQSYAAGHMAAARTAAHPHGPWQWTLDPSLLDAPPLQAESRKAYFAYSHLHLLETDGRLRVGYLSKDWGFSSVSALL